MKQKMQGPGQHVISRKNTFKTLKQLTNSKEQFFLKHAKTV